MFKFQRRILRVIPLRKKESTIGVFAEVNLLNLNYIHKYFLLLDILKSMKNNDNVQLPRTCSDHQKKNVNLSYPSFRRNLFRNSILCHGPEVWNSLPLSIKSGVNSLIVNRSKYKIKKHFHHLQLTILFMFGLFVAQYVYIRWVVLLRIMTLP